MKNNWFQSLIPNGLNIGLSGLQNISYGFKNSPDSAIHNFYMNQSGYDNINKDLYNTNQDLYGTPYFNDGGEYEDLQAEYERTSKLKQYAEWEGETEFVDYLSPKLNELSNSLKTLEDSAKLDSIKEELARQYIQNPVNQEEYIEPYQRRKLSSYDDSNYVGSLSKSSQLKGNPERIKSYLTQKGLSREAVAGIMVNIEHESGFKSGIHGDQGTSFGLFQHHATRKNNLLSYLKKRNLPSTNIEGQIDFALSEYPQLVKKLNKATSPQQAADIWVREFERPANVEKQSKLRQKSALKYMQQGGILPFLKKYK